MPGPDLSMGSTLVRNATWFADTPAYVADGCTRSHAQLYAHAARLASEAPRHVFVTDDLPISPTGKVDKKLLRARYAASIAPAG